MAVVRSGLQNYRKWIHNPRYWIIALLLVIFTNNVASALCNVASLSATKLSIWLLPFLLYDRYLQFCIALCLIMLYCDAPFLDCLQPYYLQRIGRRKWFWGQIVYIITCGTLFFLFAWFCLILLCFPHISITTDWGSCLKMLARDNPFWGAFASELILGHNAIVTTIQSLIMGSLVATLFGVLLMYFNLHFRRETGAIIAAAISVFDFFLYAYSDQLPQLFWFSPVSWTNPLQYTSENQWKWGARIFILFLLLSFLINAAIRRLQSIHIETSTEI